MSVAGLVGESRVRLISVWHQPTYRAGYLLVVNSAFAALVGAAYWFLAARAYPPSVVGVNTAAISAMMFLAGLAQLNLMDALLRFLPTAPSVARRMTASAFVLGAVLSGIAAVVFLVWVDVWAPGLSEFLRPVPTAAGFVLATMSWAVFAMQPNVLVAVGRARDVLVQNLAFAGLKVVLVVGLAVIIPGIGVWVSWTASMALVMVVTCGYLFSRAIPAFKAAPVVGIEYVPTTRDLRRFIGPDYVGSLAWIASTTLVPVLVFNLTDPARSAVFALTWSICVALYSIPTAFGQPMVARGVQEPDRLEELHRKCLRHTLAILVPMVAILVTAGPFILKFFGAWYLEHGSTVLRLLALSALPNAIVGLAIFRARAVGQMSLVVIALTSSCTMVIGLTLLLVPRLNVTGAGTAWLVAQSVVAVYVSRAQRRRPAERGERAYGTAGR